MMIPTAFPINGLKDRFNRSIDYLRLSVTDRCDLRCTYCIPKGFRNFEEPEHWLSFDEIARVVGAFARLGTRRFRLTGGEPLLRKGLVDLVEQLNVIDGVHDLSLSTNGTQLATQAYALRRAGVKRLNISLDSLRGECVQRITGSNSLDKVLHGLRIAKGAGFERIKLNMVMMQGVNENDVSDMVAFCIQHGFILRLIEMMPMGVTAQNQGFVDVQPILARLKKQFNLQESHQMLGGGPARYWHSEDGEFTVGVITPMSQHFCQTCNRVRLSVDGTLYMCLGQEERFELRPLLREGCTDEELEDAIRAAIELKPEKHEFREQPEKIIRFMSMTGG
ncbi:GTP 3',8-cyclase MoaA [Hydromonas duriensis]|uniref:GTP 3',8-cyclase n=1 Tax=Hydromonas duriensis TaxID=1527608 RepID=A0A4V3DK55_9BURK|nr:GTP 3',8-cyclase MoaA [Hydromonas duriensis]TDR32807.1 cyclic pyranopterin monophosphate synthase subunit MoaA [Hydromonas duriensis]